MRLFFYSLLVLPPLIDSVTVRTSYGQIEGFQHRIPNEQVVNVFLGIPFGKSDRFKKPTPILPWNGVLRARAFGPSCYNTFLLTQLQSRFSQLRAVDMPDLKAASEDCLSLNIVAPSLPNNNSRGYPVLFIVNGGTFELSGASLLGYDALSRNFVNKGIVSVTVNYRVGPLGYLSTEDRAFPGNYGLWDRQLALLFTREVIREFGGDPAEITVIGEGSVISAFSLSPHTNRLFKRAIALSGSMFSQLSIGANCKNDSDRLSVYFGCHSSDKCTPILEAPLDDLQRAVADIDRLDNLGGMRFLPRIDHDFFPESLDRLLHKAPPIPTITGVTQSESAMTNFYSLLQGDRRLVVPLGRQYSYSKADLVRLIRSLDDTILGQELLSFYANRRTKKKQDASFFLKLQAEMASDILFNVPIYYEASTKSLRHGWPVYLYMENFYPFPTSDLPINVTSYRNISPYIYGTFLGAPYMFSEEDRLYQKQILEGFTSFIKSGRPTVNGQQWLPITTENPDRYMSFDVQSRMATGFMKDAVDFWLGRIFRRRYRYKNLDLYFPSIVL
ncbi:hypothetical protein QR680_018156 [Steinernema hermaphroditum]|uniref:Carboxylesterase type B domain-containing protein n=1 Tax=Steinernema hermaphroditum TaxID=289476 RepID=A0AA39HHT8_9BILA|nr:hypothetical protein QR680_018156 [Steinernema hermaphroditum]